jgi:hypothetical protein
MTGVGTSSGFLTTAVGVAAGVGDGVTAGGAGGCCEQDRNNMDGKTIEVKSRRLVTARHREVFSNLYILQIGRKKLVVVSSLSQLPQSYRGFGPLSKRTLTPVTVLTVSILGSPIQP